MTATDSFRRLLPVEVPTVSGVGPRARAASPTADRLACNIAALFGVDWPTNPLGRTWVRRYDALSLKEVGQGAPGEAESTLDQVAAATLNRYRPDRKAGAVLEGAAVLFGSLVPVFDDVMRTIGSNDENEPLAADIRLAIWAALVEETYRSQPALFVAAVTARRVQRALSPSWTAAVTAGGEEFVEPVHGAKLIRDLNLLDDTLKDTIHEVLVWRGEEANVEYLREETVERWLKHLLESDAGGLAWIEEHEGRQSAVAYAAVLDLLNAFVDEVAPPQDEPQETPLGKLLPRIPTAGEFRRLPLKSQRAAIWCVMQIHRVLRDNSRYRRSGAEFQEVVTAEAERLSVLARDVLPVGDPLVPLTRARWLNKLVVDRRESDWASALEALKELRYEVDNFEALFRQGEVDRGLLAETIRTISVIVNAMMGDALDRGQYSTAAGIADGLRQDWALFLEALKLPTDLSEVMYENPGQLEAVGTHLHNYAAFLSRAGGEDDRRTAISLEANFVIPARRRAAAVQKTNKSLRLALQVFIRLLDAQYRASDNPQERELLGRQALDATLELARTDVGRKVLAVDPDHEWRSGEINTATALLAGFVVIAEGGLSLPGLTASQIDALARRAVEELQSRSGEEQSGRLIATLDLLRRLGRLPSATATGRGRGATAA